MWGMLPVKEFLDLLLRGLTRTRMIRMVQNPFQTWKLFWSLQTSQRPAETASQWPAETASQRPAETASQRPAETASQRPAETASQRPAETASQRLAEPATLGQRAIQVTPSRTRSVSWEEDAAAFFKAKMERREGVKNSNVKAFFEGLVPQVERLSTGPNTCYGLCEPPGLPDPHWWTTWGRGSAQHRRGDLSLTLK